MNAREYVGGPLTDLCGAEPPAPWGARLRAWWTRPRIETERRMRAMLTEMLHLSRDLTAAKIQAAEYEVALERVRHWNTQLLKDKDCDQREVGWLRQHVDTLKRRLEQSAAEMVKMGAETDRLRNELVAAGSARDDLEQDLKATLTRMDTLAQKLKDRRKR
jgi:hypothetical protein